MMGDESEFQIVECSATDADRIALIARRAYSDFYLDYWSDKGEGYIENNFTEEVITKDLQLQNSRYLLLIENGMDVGFMKIVIDHPLNGMEEYNSVELERIYLVQSSTGKGYGRRAMEFCFSFAKEQGKQIIWQKAMITSEAVSFYEKMGLEKKGTLELDYPLMKPDYRGMVIMMKWIE